MSSKEATKEVEADEVIAADAKKDAVKGTKRPAEVSPFTRQFLFLFFVDCVVPYRPQVISIESRLKKEKNPRAACSLRLPPFVCARPTNAGLPHALSRRHDWCRLEY